MDIGKQVRTSIQETIQAIYPSRIDPQDLAIIETKPEFEGDFTLVLFPFVKQLKKSPELLGKELGEGLLHHSPLLFSGYQLIKGFLNLTIRDPVWIQFLDEEFANPQFGKKPKNGKKIMVEYSSPNTNKPLHLGHLRNIFLGWSVAEIFSASGYDIVKTCIANDRGIHICKSMIAWQQFAGGATPNSEGIKGDHFVGDYYVMFGTVHQRQTEELVAQGMTLDQAEKEAPIMKAAQQMLLDWEAGIPEVIELWKTMNSWVYAGFEETYQRIGIGFDKIYYESETYILGKDLVEQGLKKGVFFQKEDGSVWIDLTLRGLDQKIVRRKDGTAVYITQDIGLVLKKFEEFACDQSIYVVGDEQIYHFKVLKLICEALELPSASGIHHLSYGMVELPTGRMKTREGTVVDADDILDEMEREAEKKTREQGKTAGFAEEELKALYEKIGLGGLKFFLLRVDSRKRILFNPEESIDLHGFTATFIQYAHARIRSILRKEEVSGAILDPASPHQNGASGRDELLPLEKSLLVQLGRYPGAVEQACAEMNPSLVALYGFNLAKIFNSFYAEHSIAHAENPFKKELRLKMASLTELVLKSSMNLLGINLPERM
jgi:arginyl-tRNA synthetase